MEAIFQVLVEPEDDGFVTFVPALDFASTQGSTREEALERTREMILGYLAAAEKEGIAIEIPPPSHRAEMIDLPISA